MVCSACGTPNENGRKFCKECGSALALACPSCGSANSADSKFCGECGSALAAPAAAPLGGPHPEPEGTAPSTERRLVSVLFADLVGFTTLSEKRDAEDVRELLSKYFDSAREIVDRYGGLVEKFIGDAVMAVWGTPAAHEDDAERAVRAALELVDGVENLGREVGVALRARAGVLTGEAAVTVGAVGQGIVTGDLVNTASRLQSAAEPGAVLVGESTVRAASKAIAFDEAGALALKGKEEPVPAWRALRVVGMRGGEGRPEALEPPFVGRDEELRLLKELLHATGRERKARLVSVTGIGGIGKSRLASECLKYIDGLVEDVYWHQGRCPAYGDGVTFWALGEMVRMRARIAEIDDPAESRRKLLEAIALHVTDGEERRWVEPRLMHLLGLAERPPGEREELFAAWRCFFERIAERGTTLMVFEDLQWADPGLLEFIGSMLEWSRNHPILIVTLARPEIVDKRPGWGADQRNFTALRLEPLPDTDMAEMVEGFVRGLPSDGVKLIVGRAEGVPLYAVETVRMLAGRGILAPGDTTYEVVGDLVALEIPETLHALIAARLDALAPEDRSLLQDASVLGKSFTVQGLSAVAGRDPDDIEPRLRELVRKEFLSHDADPRSPERGQYGFLQGLIREVAYSTLSKSERRRRHLAAAHFLESIGDEELAGIVAAHYMEAHAVTPEGPDAEAIAARARDWLAQAADRALSLGSPGQALGYAEQALSITSDGSERTSLLQRAGEAADRAGAADRAVALLEEAIALHTARGDPTAAAFATAMLYPSLAVLDRGSEAVDRMEGALGAIGEDGDELARAQLCSRLAEANMRIGLPDRALDWSERALLLAERLDLPELISRAIPIKAGALFDLGRHREAAILVRGGISLAEEIGSIQLRADAQMRAGNLFFEDDPKEALDLMIEAARLAKRAGVRVLELISLANAVESAIDIGRWDEADIALAELEGQELPGLTGHGVALSRAMLAAWRGDFETGTIILDDVAPRTEAVESIHMRTWFHRARSVVNLLRGDLEGAYEDASRAVELAPTGINSPMAAWDGARAALWLRDPARVRMALEMMARLRGRWIVVARTTVEAGLAALEGRRDDASAGYNLAVEGWESLSTPLDLAFCAVDMATLLPDDGLTAEMIPRARAILTDLGAKPLLDRLAASARDEAAAEAT